MAETNTMVLVFGFGFLFSAGFARKVFLVPGRRSLSFWFQFWARTRAWDVQRMLVILAGDSAIAIARFRPSKELWSGQVSQLRNAIFFAYARAGRHLKRAGGASPTSGGSRQLGAPKTPPLEILYVRPFLVIEGRRGPKHGLDWSSPCVLPYSLVTRPKSPPYRQRGVATPPSHCVSCGIVDYRCYTPTSFRKNGLSQSKDRPNGYRRKCLPLKPIAL